MNLRLKTPGMFSICDKISQRTCRDCAIQKHTLLRRCARASDRTCRFWAAQPRHRCRHDTLQSWGLNRCVLIRHARAMMSSTTVVQNKDGVVGRRVTSGTQVSRSQSWLGSVNGPSGSSLLADPLARFGWWTAHAQHTQVIDCTTMESLDRAAPDSPISCSSLCRRHARRSPNQQILSRRAQCESGSQHLALTIIAAILTAFFIRSLVAFVIARVGTGRHTSVI